MQTDFRVPSSAYQGSLAPPQTRKYKQSVRGAGAADRGCRFCSLSQKPVPDKQPFWDRPIIETADSLVVSTKGCLVEGWLLAIPKSHKLSSAALDFRERQDLASVVDQACHLLEKVYGTFTIFEHGAAQTESSFGCGIDHAHVHIVPLTFDLYLRTTDQFPGIEWESSPAPWREPGSSLINRPYIAIEDFGGDPFVANPENIPRQFFRRIIAEECGAPLRFDYDTAPFSERAQATWERLNACKRMSCSQPR